jgi:uncharacterized Ntn-hydrolase superfamily protein
MSLYICEAASMRTGFALIVIACLAGCAQPQVRVVGTFSIVAFDPQTDELGIAVASKFIAVGAVVPWARAGIGAVATQAWANTTYGPLGLRMLDEGLHPQEVIEKLTSTDEAADHRQVGIVDAQGRSATYTGAECNPWAGGRAGPNYAVQGNILAGEHVVDAMARAFEAANGDLGDRLLAALSAGDEAGGDVRGRQSAALLIVRQHGGYSGYNDRYRDLRVDDHERPVQELHRIYELHRKVFPPPEVPPDS